MERPECFDTPWVEFECDNWHLKEGTPQEVVDEFREYMEQLKEAENRGVCA